MHNQVTDSKRTKKFEHVKKVGTCERQLLLSRVLELCSDGSDVGCATTRQILNSLMVTELAESVHSVGFEPTSQELAFSFPLKSEIFLREGRVLISKASATWGASLCPVRQHRRLRRGETRCSQLPSSRRAPSSIFRAESSKL